MSKLTVYLACFKAVGSTGLCWEGSLLTQYLEFRMGLKDLSPEDQIVVNEIDRIIEGYYQTALNHRKGTRFNFSDDTISS